MGVFSTGDPDQDAAFTYSFTNGDGSSDNAYFTINGDTLKIIGTTGFETKSVYSIRVRSTDSGGMFVEKTFPIAIIEGVVTFPDWAAAAGLSETAALPNSEPYGDGVPNLLKYAFNMNGDGPDRRILLQNGSTGLPRSELDSSDGQSIVRLEYLRRKGNGLMYAAQRTRNLTDYEPLKGTESVSTIDSHWERVTIVAPFQPLSEPRSFFRVQVKQQ